MCKSMPLREVILTQLEQSNAPRVHDEVLSGNIRLDYFYAAVTLNMKC